MPESHFVTLSRQKFRRQFQPSRIVLGVLPSNSESGVNVITLCFDMHCSYKPPMMAVAIQQGTLSYELIQSTTEFVLAVPGTSMADETMFCGVTSGRDVDKVRELKLELSRSEKIKVPGLKQAIANIELSRAKCIDAGDHLLVLGRVLRFAVNPDRDEAPLLSIGPDTRGYVLLAQKGIHRVATVATDSSRRLNASFGQGQLGRRQRVGATGSRSGRRGSPP